MIVFGFILIVVLKLNEFLNVFGVDVGIGFVLK